MSEETNLQILYSHYEDTCVTVKGFIKLRDKLMIIVLAIFGILTLCVFWPTDAISAVSQMIQNKTGAEITLSPIFLGCVIWFGLFVSIMRYLQVLVSIERQYSYIHKLEEALSSNYKDSTLFTRESKSYLNKYPAFSNWTCFVYTKIFPAVLIIAVLFKIVNEWLSFDKTLLIPILFNTVISVFILVSLVLYVLFMRKQDK